MRSHYPSFNWNNPQSLVQFSLVVVLLLPITYYPFANAFLYPSVARIFPGLENLSRVFLASAVALLVIFTLLISLFNQSSSPAFHGFHSLLGQPETWFVLAILWLIGVTLINKHPTSVQNFAVYVLVVAILLQCRLGTGQLSQKLKPITILLASVVVFAGIIGLWATGPFYFIGSNPRLFATYGVLIICLMFAIRVKNSFRILFIALVYGSIVVSQSRTALVAAILVGALGIIFTASRPWLTSLGVCAGAGGLLLLTLNIPFMAERMSPSSITTPGFPIDDSGRLVVWRAIIESIAESPIIGQGAGSGQTVALASNFSLEHPHSEYLRVLHDGGLITAVLVSVGIVIMLVLLRPRRNGLPSHPHVVGGFLVLIAGLSMGTIENFLVFPSIMWPGAVMVGLALSTSRRLYRPRSSGISALS